MDLHKIASRVARIARVETVGDSSRLTELISDDIKSRFKIPSSAQPFKSGSFSSVFENSEGNIVAFVDTPNACESAYTAVGRNLTTVPEVYDLDTFSVTKEDAYETTGGYAEPLDVNICVIVMEKLTPLTREEINQLNNIDPSGSDDLMDDPGDAKIRLEKMLENIDEIQRPYPYPIVYDKIDLLQRMDEEGIGHDDFHPGNVAWGHDGKLKLIDWESIYFR